MENNKNNIQKMKKFPSEHLIQISCIAYFRNEYERYGKGIIIPVPNELAAKRKDVEIRKGCSDLIVVMSKRIVFMELKTGYNIQSDAQVKFQKEVESLGYEYHIIRSLEQFKKVISL